MFFNSNTLEDTYFFNLFEVCGPKCFVKLDLLSYFLAILLEAKKIERFNMNYFSHFFSNAAMFRLHLRLRGFFILKK